MGLKTGLPQRCQPPHTPTQSAAPNAKKRRMTLREKPPLPAPERQAQHDESSSKQHGAQSDLPPLQNMPGAQQAGGSSAVQPAPAPSTNGASLDPVAAVLQLQQAKEGAAARVAQLEAAAAEHTAQQQAHGRQVGELQASLQGCRAELDATKKKLRTSAVTCMAGIVSVCAGAAKLQRERDEAAAQVAAMASPAELMRSTVNAARLAAELAQAQQSREELATQLQAAQQNLQGTLKVIGMLSAQLAEAKASKEEQAAQLAASKQDAARSAAGLHSLSTQLAEAQIRLEDQAEKLAEEQAGKEAAAAAAAAQKEEYEACMREMALDAAAYKAEAAKAEQEAQSSKSEVQAVNAELADRKVEYEAEMARSSKEAERLREGNKEMHAVQCDNNVLHKWLGRSDTNLEDVKREHEAEMHQSKAALAASQAKVGSPYTVHALLCCQRMHGMWLVNKACMQLPCRRTHDCMHEAFCSRHISRNRAGTCVEFWQA
jgi:chromosome segregation ATPase